MTERIVTRTREEALPHFRAVIVSIIKNEADDILEWISFHKAVGFEHFFLYDNNSTDNTASLLAPLVQEGIVTLIDWPKSSGQLPAYQHALKMFSGVCEWMCFLDADEFVVTKRHATISDYLKGVDAAQILLPWRNFGFSGHRRRPPGLLIENFLKSRPLSTLSGEKIHTKCIVRPGSVKVIGVHFCLVGNETTVDWELDAVKAVAFPVYRPFDSIQVNHYYYKSFEDYGKKIARGSATGAILKEATSFEYIESSLTEEDGCALKYLTETKKNLAYYKRLPPSLFRYGRQLGQGADVRVGQMAFMADRVAFDPFKWFFQRAISDYVLQRKRVSVQYKELAFVGKGNRFALSVTDDMSIDEPWSESLHFRHLAQLLAAEILFEDDNPAVDGDGDAVVRLVRDLPSSDHVHCYAVMVHVVAADGGEMRVAGSGEDWSVGHAVAYEGGSSILVCEINPVPRDVDAISIELGAGARIKRLLVFRYA